MRFLFHLQAAVAIDIMNDLNQESASVEAQDTIQQPITGQCIIDMQRDLSEEADPGECF